MANSTIGKGETLEVLGTCMTNTTPGSTHVAKVEYRHLWSYAQQAALIAVSDKNPKTGCYELITDPERRAKRIAAHYADLYFKSGEKSKGKMQIYWPALAAFVVKDIVEGFRFSREEVLQREWNDASSAGRNSSIGDIGSFVFTGESPYQHVLRTYAALAKGNLWLFMDIYPWLWFVMEFGVNPDGTLNEKRLTASPSERDWATFQTASKSAVEELPFGQNWLARLSTRLAGDIVFQKGRDFFKSSAAWSADDGYGHHGASAYSAHQHCKKNVHTYDNGYRMPPSKYWKKFGEPFYIMEAEHSELTSIIRDSKASAALLKIRRLTVTPEIQSAYSHLRSQFKTSNPEKKQIEKEQELAITAQHEQINVLQPLIYNDPRLKATMDANHKFSRWSAGMLSPEFKVVFAFDPQIADKSLKAIFDVPKNIKDRYLGSRKSLPNEEDRMGFVAEIARKFNDLMQDKLPYMENEMKKIRGWMNA